MAESIEPGFRTRRETRDMGSLTIYLSDQLQQQERPAGDDAPPPASATPAPAPAAGRGVLGDIGTGLTEAPKQILGGARDALVEFGQSVESLTQWLREHTPLGRLPEGPKLQVNVPEVKEPESVTGGLVRGVSQFLSAFIPATRAVKAAGVAGAVTRPAAAGALADVLAFDPHDPRASNLINDLAPALRTPITEYLAAKPDDTEAEGRLKNALEGLGLGLAVEGVVRAVKAMRAARRVRDGVAVESASAASRPQLALPPAPIAAGPSSLAMTPDELTARLLVLGEQLRGRGPAPSSQPAARAVRAGAAEPVAILPPADVRPAAPPRSTELRTSAELTGAITPPPATGLVDEFGRPVVAERPVAAAPPTQPTIAPEGPLKSQAELAGATGRLSPEEELLKTAVAAERAIADALKTGRVEGLEDLGPAGRELLAQAMVGAFLGAATADEEESALDRAAAGFGLGALPPGLRRKIAGKLRGAFQPNFRRIDAPGDVKRMMRSVQAMAKESVEAQRRGVVSQDETRTAAELLIETGKMNPERILGFEPGTVLNDAEITAARHISVQAAHQATDIAEQILRGEPVTPGELRKAMALLGGLSRNTKAVQTELGRATAAGRIMARAEGVGPIRADPDRLAMIADEIGLSASEEDLARIVMAEAKDPEKVSRLARFLTGLPGAWLEAVYGSMLSGKALIRNLVGNVALMPVGAWERTIAAYMPKFGSRLPGVMPGEGPQAFIGLWEGTLDQLRMIRHLDVEGLSTQAEALVTRKLDRPDAGPRFTAQKLGLDDTPLELFADWTGTAFRVPLDVMNMTDGASKAINGRVAIRWEAYRQAAREGFEGEAFSRRFQELVDDYTKLDDSALARVKDYRDTMTFTKDFEGRILSAMQHGPENDWLNLAYRLSAFTFVRTPLRLAEEGALRTPGLNLLMAQFWRDIRAGGVPRQLAQARLVTGAAVIGSFNYLAWQGLITGTAPTDPSKRAVWEAAGFQEKSWWDVASGKWRSYDGMEPLTTLVATGADLARYTRELPEADAYRLFLASVLSQIDNLNSKSYSQSVSQLLDLIKNPRSDSRVEQATEYIRRRMQTAFPVPLSGAVREVEGLVDPARRRVMPNGSIDSPLGRELQALVDSYRASIPFWSDAKDEHGNDLVPAHRNLITGEIIVNESWPYNVFAGRTPKPSSVFDELIRLQGAGLRELPDFLGSRPAANVGLTAPARPSVSVRLTPQERDRWVVLMTQEVRDGQGHSLHDSLADLVADTRYLAQSDLRRRELIQARFNFFRERAEDRLLDEAPKLRLTLQQQRGEAQIQRRPPADQADLRRQLLERLGPGLVIPKGGERP